jgi:hypothetical protein
MDDGSDMIFIVALIKRVNNDDKCSRVRLSTQSRKGFDDQLAPLIVHRQIRNIPILCDGGAHVLIKRRYKVRKLHGNSGEELSCITDIATAS